MERNFIAGETVKMELDHGHCGVQSMALDMDCVVIRVGTFGENLQRNRRSK